MEKLNLGAGKDIENDYVNHDIANLEGIDIVHDLNKYPWPWKDSEFSEILCMDILEHLDDFVKAMEEIHRILKKDGEVLIRVPYWNSYCAYADPTHKKGFHELTFRFFDIDSQFYKERDYYSNAKFKIIDEALILVPDHPYFRMPFIGMIEVRRRFSKRIIGWFGNHISNVIHDIKIRLKKV